MLKKLDDSTQWKVFMKNQKLQIECGRCGFSRSEILTGEEARILKDGIGPVYRQCDKCEKTTGWIETAVKHTTDAAKQQPVGAQSKSGSNKDRPVAHGQERLATATERDEIDAMLDEPYEVQNTK